MIITHNDLIVNMPKKIINLIDIKNLKEKFFNNPIFNQIKEKYPFRDYNYQFDLMCDWWIGERNKLPTNISAFNQWLSRTQIDENVKRQHDNQENKEKWRKLQEEMENQKCKDASDYLNKIKKELSQKWNVRPN